MSIAQQIITVAVVVAATVFTRAIAFIAFPEGKKTPEYIQYLGRVLPAAALGMLVIYCIKDVSIFSKTHALPEIISIGIVTGLHLWKKNMFLSIGGGTICYMLLIQLCHFS
jgi:branched-subunit amino acid transport protein AzlD